MMLIPPFVAEKAKELKEKIEAAQDSEEARIVKRVGIILAVIFVAMFALMFAKVAGAKAFAAYTDSEGVVYIATDEPCKVKGAPRNLSLRLMLHKGKKQIEACYAPVEMLGVLITYAEGEIGLVAMQGFRPLETM